MNMPINRQWRVARRPEKGGLALSPEIFGHGEVAVPEPGPGEVLIRAA